MRRLADARRSFEAHAYSRLERRRHVSLDGWLGLVLDELHDGVLGFRARRCCLRRCEAGEPAADKPEEPVLGTIEGDSK